MTVPADFDFEELGIEPGMDPDSEEARANSRRLRLRRLDQSLDGLDRLVASIEYDVAESGLGPHEPWDDLTAPKKCRKLAHRLDQLAHELSRDERYNDPEDHR